MPRLAANLSYLFTEVDFLDRFAAAARAGFRAVEYQFPYAHDKQAIAERLAENDLEMVLVNLPVAALNECGPKFLIQQGISETARDIENIFGIHHDGGVTDDFRQRTCV